MDALLDLFETDAKRKESTASEEISPSLERDKPLENNRLGSSLLEKDNNRLSTTQGSSNPNIDPISKIRIISRKISGAEQVDLLAPYKYHSSIALASMNNQTLASLVVAHPNRSSPTESIGGKTNMATIGIILSFSGTKTSSKGASFIAITIGELHTGPALSILVFGDAYSAYTGKISNGQVIAVLASTILPPKAGSGETRITVTIRDKYQLQIIGVSHDYGICSGSERRKVNGILENVPCRMHIDKRSGCFCKFHSKPNHQSYYDDHNKLNKKKMTFIESMKDDQRRNQAALQVQHSVDPRSISNRPFSTQTTSLQMRGILPVQSKDTLRSLLSSEKANNPNHRPMSSQIMGDAHKGLSNNQTKSNAINPYAKKTKAIGKGNKEIQNDVLGIVLSGNTNPSFLSMPSSTSLHAVNRRPQRLLNSTNLVTPQRDSTFVVNQVLDQQKLIAASLKNRSSQDHTPISHVNNVKNTLPCASFESVFGIKTLDQQEKLQILETKSRYSREAEQELYVQARLKLTELETKEEVKQKLEAIKEAKKNRKGNGCIETIWKCQTCHQTFSYRPVNCIKSKHYVGMTRNIKNSILTKSEERLNLTRKSIEDGGLVLGTGLNWSGLKDGSDSD